MAEKPTQVLRNSHKTIAGLADQLQSAAARTREMEAGVFKELCMMIEIHAALEEEIFYPALESGLETGLLVAAGRDELSEVRARLRPICPGRAGDMGARARMEEAVSLFLLHAKTEEEQLFKKADLAGGGDAQSLGTRILARRAELLGDPRYRDALPAHVQDPNGGEQKRKSA